MVRDYHKWMGGVDIHDQLRLQRYSIRLRTWCKTNYKSIFMGLLGVAIANVTCSAEHEPRENPDYQVVNGVRKRRQRQCNVCSNRKRHIGQRRGTKYYCEGCSKSDQARFG
ncbi:hypothetical protein F444_02833 [Phytophthora nicotianae P1976]|uniref:PiggyBac transposable element-derived protein 4 C-terminal zinc-ribbon domain-containing protein n=1 Tax=Phytophthora nicotianae P1976 TaxID=1317066 RepID=A0A081AW42_PHYNI|nr:hypothetical protein F444_02833 [Phytophthora nicotianae P1976]